MIPIKILSYRLPYRLAEFHTRVSELVEFIYEDTPLSRARGVHLVD